MEFSDIFSQGEDLESCGGFSWVDLLGAQVQKVPDVTDVSLSFSLVFRVVLIGMMLNISPFLSPKSDQIVAHVRKKR